jgi:polyhydroxybutyrate depolymerase
LPLVVVLHGGGANAPAIVALTGFNAEADEEGFVVAYPNGTGRAKPTAETTGQFSWNAGDCCGSAMRQDADDSGFVRALVAAIEHERPIDRRRVYAAGFSAGGMMAYRLACEADDIFAAVGVVSGAILVPSCAPKQPVSVIDIHGTDDDAVPIDGTPERESYARAKFPPVRESVAFWAAFNGCRLEPVALESVPGIQAQDYPDCRDGTAVRYDVVDGGYHAWPDGSKTPGFAATPHIWHFFADHPRLKPASG